tara:strand:+ start:515 stop:895 length:381 start_codon:yes stop_codon:yes gene_type:complete
MADTKVSDLDPITIPSNNDLLYLVDTSSSTSKKITFQNLLSGVDLRVTNLDTTVSTFTNEVLALSSDFQTANIDVAPLTTDILTISGQVVELSAVQEARPEGVTNSFVISTSTFTFAGGQLTSVTT